MSDNLTEKLPGDNHLNELLTLVRGIDAKLDSVDKRVEALEKKVEALDKRVDALEKKVDERLYDTRPIWENVQEQLNRLDGHVSGLQEQVSGLQEQVNGLQSEMEKGFRQIGRQMDTLAGNYVRLDASLRDLEDRFKNTEPRVS